MERRTREYLRGRFGDYYREARVALPPDADAREWGYIPWSEGGTRMVRHRSRLELGAVGDFLADEAPRHVYFSAATYDDPGAESMDAKGWRGADLVFDLDADHLPGVDPRTTPYAEMLADCKDALERLLDLLVDDFGVDDDDAQVVFSGGRGYHVHVRAPGVRPLDSAARREVVDYVRGVDVDGDALVHTRQAGTTTRRTLRSRGGWGRRALRRLRALAADLDELEREAALARLTAYDNVGETRAERVLDALSDPAVVERGDVERGGPGLRILLDALVEETLAEETAPIDEPVTTDVRRLIRLPGSLHGGSGLVVRRLDPGAVSGFDPLSDAVPDRFRGREVRIRVPDEGDAAHDDGTRADGGASGRFDGDSFMFAPGTHTVNEPLAVFLMCRGTAEKERE